jgi:predicted nuclease of predicted toxin-antitoxin system
VKLLFDQNVSRHLVGMFALEYPGSRHVTDVGLDTATDAEIWAYAGEHDFIIVSKDSDFRQLAFLHGPPPKAIWVRPGSVSTIEIYNVLGENHDEIDRFAGSAEEALLVLR